MAITESPVHYYGHGEIWMGDHVAGAMPTTMNDAICEIDMMEVSLAPSFAEHISKRTSVAKKDIKFLTTIAGSGKLTCAQHSANLLKKYLYGTKTTVTGGSFAATAFANGAAVVGDYLPLPGNKTKVSSLVITDSTGSPVTATLGTHYEADADAGMIKILSLAGLTQPLKAAGTEAAGTSVEMFQSTPNLQGLRFKGINLANTNSIVIVNLPKIHIAPAATWTLLNDGADVNKYEIDFEILNDVANTTYGFGQYRE